MIPAEKLAEARKLAAAVSPLLRDGWQIINGGLWCNSSKGGVTHIVDIRGWGYLTGGGHGANGLPEDEAAAIQDALCVHIAAFSPTFALALLDEIAELRRDSVPRKEMVDRINIYRKHLDAANLRATQAEARAVRAETSLTQVIEAASKIKHWHDTLYNKDTGETEGMVVSASHVRDLWAALASIALSTPAAATDRGSEDDQRVDQLLDRRHALEHEYGESSFRDGLVRDKIAEITAEIASIRAKKEV